MNQHDRDNLNFLLKSSPETLQDWFDTIVARGETDDIMYALELIAQARNELELELLEYIDEDAEHCVAEASEYLKKFQL